MNPTDLPRPPGHVTMTTMANAWTSPRWRVVTIAALILVGVGAAWLVVTLLGGRRRAGGSSAALAKIIDKARSDISTANARAAVELAIAKQQDDGTRLELDSIAADPDEQRRLARLVSLRERVRTQ